MCSPPYLDDVKSTPYLQLKEGLSPRLLSRLLQLQKWLNTQETSGLPPYPRLVESETLIHILRL